jgi:hypothetical protein
MADLTGVRLKLQRAQQHFDAFRKLTSDLRDGNTNYASQRYNHEVGQYEWVVEDDWIIPKACPAILGDCLHNARSALDHLAWQLAANPGRHTYFPIWGSAEEFSQRAPAQMRTMKPSAMEKLEGLQPYSQPETLYALGYLHELDIMDKHRLLLVTTMRTTGGTATGGLPDDVRIRFISEPFGRGAVFMTAEMPFDPAVHVNYLPAADIYFAEPPVKNRMAEFILYKVLQDIETVVLPTFDAADFW